MADLSLSDLQRLQQVGVTENQRLEFKLDLPTPADADVKKFLANVSSFWQGGGDLIYGIEAAREDGARGTIKRLRGLPNVERDHAVQRLETLLRDGLDPRVPGVRMTWVEGGDEGPLLAIRIPQSWVGPHMITFKDWARFYSRNNAGKYIMDTTQLRSAFLAADSVASVARRFRAQRIAVITNGDTPIPLVTGARLCLHVVPIHPEGRDFVSGSPDDAVRPMNVDNQDWSRRLNLDGSLTVGHKGPNGALEYTLLYRDGSLEAVDAALDYFVNQEIPSYRLEQSIIAHAQSYVAALRKLGVESPLALFVTLVNVKNFRLGMARSMENRRREPPTFDRDLIDLPDLIVEGDEVTATALRPILDVLWQSAGVECSPYFDSEGVRIVL